MMECFARSEPRPQLFASFRVVRHLLMGRKDNGRYNWKTVTFPHVAAIRCTLRRRIGPPPQRSVSVAVGSMTIRNAVLSAGDLFLDASDPGMGVSEREVAGFHEEPDAAQEVFLNNSLIPPTEQ
ncbi:MAG: hypothetical protein KDA81_16620 [Planctomycetaceae bacterium]|nr:hypothetical protein [Planctomycetaceae bacterium]